MTAKTALLSGKQTLHALLSPADRFTCLLFWLCQFFLTWYSSSLCCLASLTHHNVLCTFGYFSCRWWTARLRGSTIELDALKALVCIAVSIVPVVVRHIQEKTRKNQKPVIVCRVCFVLCFHHLRNFFFALKVAFRSWSADLAVVKRWY